MAGRMKDYILLVEDNPDDVELTRRALGKVDEALDLVVAYDGEEGLEACRGTGKFEQEGSWAPPFLILLDLKLPKLSGLELLPCFRTEDQV
jgi:two-component system, response regulator